jgi:hypothetical protein
MKKVNDEKYKSCECTELEDKSSFVIITGLENTMNC